MYPTGGYVLSILPSLRDFASPNCLTKLVTPAFRGEGGKSSQGGLCRQGGMGPSSQESCSEERRGICPSLSRLGICTQGC